MDIVGGIVHGFNFALPAFAVALITTMMGRFFKQNKPLAQAFITKFAINFVACFAVLLIGLMLTGRDGKMLTYAAMVLTSGTVQWIISGGWRKP